MSQQPATFRTHLVKAADLPDHLSKSTVKADPNARAIMLRERYRAIKQRYDL
jgi:hypothetical protein